MKGVRCSWVDMQAIRQALSGGQRGEQKALELMRCVDHSTVSTWKAACALLDAVDGKCEISHISAFQPSHAVAIARHFRKEEGKEWSEDTRDEIAEWVSRCEAEEWTVQQLRLELQAAAARRMIEEGEPVEEDKEDETTPFNWIAEMNRIHKWLTRQRKRFPTGLRPGFTDLVRRVLARMESEDDGGRQGAGSSPAGDGQPDPG